MLLIVFVMQQSDFPGSSCFHPQENMKVPVVTLDRWCEEHGVIPDFIKMDLEGAEVKVVLGMKKLFANAFKALGLVGVAMPYTEVISSLQTNMIDGHVDNIYSHDYYDMPRTCTYVIPVPLAVMPMALVVSSKWWNGLPQAERDVLTFTINSIDTMKYFDENQAKVLTWWEQNNGVVVKMTPEFETEWKKCIAEANKDFIKDLNPALLDAIQKTAH